MELSAALGYTTQQRAESHEEQERLPQADDVAWADGVVRGRRRQETADVYLGT